MIDENLLKEKIAELFYKNINAKYADIAKVIDEQPTVNQWIPYSERLPNEDMLYNATIINELNNDIWTDSVYYNDALNEFETREDFYNVIAWQPLPEPYKKEV